MTCQYSVIPNQKTVVDDVFNFIFLRHKLGPKTFTGTALTYKREDFNFCKKERKNGKHEVHTIKDMGSGARGRVRIAECFE
jgi:hypothetical protein